MTNSKDIKSALYQHCQKQLQDKIHMLQSALKSIAEARDNETKSSVGDKYETGRAMMQLEEEKYRTQLAQVIQSKTILDRIDIMQVAEIVKSGSLVETDSGWYFLTIAIGKVKQENRTYFVISTESPIGRLLLHKKVGDQVEFQGRKLAILNIS